MSKPGPTRRARYQVPGKAEAEMRIVGEQRLAGHRVRARQDPFVRCLALARGDVVGRPIELVEGDALQGLVDQRQGRVAALARRSVRSLTPSVVEVLRQAQAHQLVAPVAVEPERHDFRPDQRVGRAPGVGPVLPPVSSLTSVSSRPNCWFSSARKGSPRQHRNRVCARRGRQGVDALRRAPVKAEAAHRAIGLDQARSRQSTPE